ncbi:hypothetical protein [Martelella endophytica]|uniref:Bacteriophage tail tape measure N-terminal domain-containing protein n=1 Tax=Martelella endophytica TaxID=1486262 RepID=A0A0D5LMX5_MAREN|nr:hypothetical protein [Martelella endophytica]AJY44663.1 hypothetical protein TM49_01540 [Martelella endophytica]
MAENDDRLVLRLEASITGLEKRLAKANSIVGRSMKQMQEITDRAQQKMAQSAEHSANAIGAEMDRLRAKYDPLFRASKLYETELEELNRALKVGAIDNRVYGESLTALNARYTAAAVGSRSLVVQGKNVSRMTPGLQAGIQNVAYQIGDFAVQVGAGTAASKALGMQMPQLLGGFGVLGAVLGAVVAIAVPLASSFIDLGEAGEDADKKLKELQSAVDAYRDAVREANLPTKELAEKYGTATFAAKEFLDVLKDINRFRAEEELNNTFSDLSQSYGDLRRVPGADPSDRIASIYQMMDALDITVGSANNLAKALNALGDANGPEEQMKAAEGLLKALEDALGPFDDMNQSAQDLYNSVAEAGRSAADLKAAMELADVSISTAASEAGRLADEIGRAVQNAAALAASGISDLARAKIEWQFRDDPIGKAGAITRQNFAETKPPQGDLMATKEWMAMRDEAVANAKETAEYAQQLENWRKEQAKLGRKSRGGGGRSKKEKESIFASSDDQLLRLERNLELLGKTDRQVAELEARWQLLDAAKERGLSLDMQIAGTGETVGQQIDKQAEAVGRLTEKYNEAKDRAEYFEGIQADIKDGLLDAIVAGEDFAGVLEDVAKSLAKAALNAVLFNEGPFSSGHGSGLLGSLFSGLGGLFKSEKGNAFGTSGAKPFAKGGSFTNSIVSSPTFFKFGSGGKKNGVMGEKDPEAVMPLVRAANGDLGVRAVREATGAGGGQVAGRVNVASDVRVYMDENGQWQAEVQRISRRESSSAVTTGLANYHRAMKRGGVGEMNKTFDQQKG